MKRKRNLHYTIEGKKRLVHNIPPPPLVGKINWQGISAGGIEYLLEDFSSEMTRNDSFCLNIGQGWSRIFVFESEFCFEVLIRHAERNEKACGPIFGTLGE